MLNPSHPLRGWRRVVIIRLGELLLGCLRWNSRACWRSSVGGGGGGARVLHGLQAQQYLLLLTLLLRIICISSLSMDVPPAGRISVEPDMTDSKFLNSS